MIYSCLALHYVIGCKTRLFPQKQVSQLVLRRIVTCFLVFLCFPIQAKDNSTLNIAYLNQLRAVPSGVPSYLERPENEGINGADLGIEDANITGRFAGFNLSIKVYNWDLSTAFSDTKKSEMQQADVILLDTTSADFTQAITLVTNVNPQALIFNIANADNIARRQFCQLPLLHTIASYQMKTDALGQWYRTKRLQDILLIQGLTEEDELYRQAFERTAQKFKLDIVEQKTWQFSFDLRRAAFAEIPLFTRTKDKYEAIFVADAQQQFAYSLPYNTHLQVPVTGDAGLRPLGWHHTHEQWGARQVQRRFKERYQRPMNEIDYAAYVSVIAISTSLQSGTDKEGLALFKSLQSDQMAIAAYKGRKLSFRQVSGQLRQPILLANEAALVTHAPLSGFLHKSNELDTLGESITSCKGTTK